MSIGKDEGVLGSDTVLVRVSTTADDISSEALENGGAVGPETMLKRNPGDGAKVARCVRATRTQRRMHAASASTCRTDMCSICTEQVYLSSGR